MLLPWLAIWLVLAAVPALAQDRSGSGISTPNSAIGDGRPGIGVDSKGNQVIDPTKNVLDLVLAAVKRLDDLNELTLRRADDLRAAADKYQNTTRDSAVQRINDLRDAETRRINELAAQKQIFDLELARVIRANQESSTLLLAAQLKEVKGDSAERMAKLEQFANEQRGRASASDPANTQLLLDVKALIQSRAGAEGKNTGQGEMIGWVVAGIMMLIALGGLAAAFMRQPRHTA